MAEHENHVHALVKKHEEAMKEMEKNHEEAEKKHKEVEVTRTEHDKQVADLIQQLRRQIEMQQGTTKLLKR
jgi:F0F1-type ATP synthase membrane subunit b/b'